MKLAKMYANEFKPGGGNECIKCSRQCHSNYCSFCIDKTLRELGVSVKTMRDSSAVFRSSSNSEKIKQAIKAIEGEIK